MHNNDDNKELDKQIIGLDIRETVPPWRSSSSPPLATLEENASKGPYVGEYRNYNKDEDLAKLLDGKRVALVCPSPHLIGQKMGKIIDSYDYVIRVNQAFHMPEDMWEDYGQRTDMLMSCLNINKLWSLARNEEFVKSLKYLICPNVSLWDIERVEDFLAATGIPGHNVDDGYLLRLYNEVGTTCNTGLTSVVTLLNYDIEELYVTGMTFFNMAEFGKVYFDMYHDHAVENDDIISNKNREPLPESLRMDIHDQISQICYFSRVVSEHYGNRLTIDDYLIDNFRMAAKGVLKGVPIKQQDELVELEMIISKKFGYTIDKRHHEE
tara:strand:+ start:585 stop:1556 length:972 start_codon:yes stop_codon:yes gene_type:complete